MEPITQGSTGVAVEDIQARLAALGYKISEDERSAQSFGPSTATAVARFRLDHDLPLGAEVDAATWSTLVDEGYCMGDRTLYLRLPNFPIFSRTIGALKTTSRITTTALYAASASELTLNL